MLLEVVPEVKKSMGCSSGVLICAGCRDRASVMSRCGESPSVRQLCSSSMRSSSLPQRQSISVCRICAARRSSEAFSSRRTTCRPAGTAAKIVRTQERDPSHRTPRQVPAPNSSTSSSFRSITASAKALRLRAVTAPFFSYRTAVRSGSSWENAFRRSIKPVRFVWTVSFFSLSVFITHRLQRSVCGSVIHLFSVYHLRAGGA